MRRAATVIVGVVSVIWNSFGIVLTLRQRAPIFTVAFDVLAIWSALLSIARHKKRPDKISVTHVTLGAAPSGWSHDGRPEAHGCRDPTSFSAYHRCGMKRFSRARILRNAY